MRLYHLVISIVTMGGMLAAPSIASGSTTFYSSPSSPAQVIDEPRTINDALNNKAYLARFDSVDLAKAQRSAPILNAQTLTGKGNVATAKAAAACSWTAFTSLLGTYGPVSWGCGIAGRTGYNKPYRWTYGAAASVCSQGIGYSSSGVATWYYTGCAGGARTVPWGNRLAQSQFHVVGPALNMFVVPWQD